jgi:hypothetical protein
MNHKTFRDGYCVLLCAHNGAAHLAEQLDSIARQDLPPARVVFFDDASSDDTLGVARRFADVLPITFVQLEKRRGGAAGAFDAILRNAAQSPEVFVAYLLCDQDDIWEPFKAARLVGALTRTPSGRPALAHSELKCFGEAAAGREYLHQSLGHLRCDSTPAQPLQSLLFENVLVGASAAFNRALLERAVPMPLLAFMHDWWLAIVCVSHGGDIHYLPEALTRYRIHGKSTIGRAGSFLHALPRRLKALRESAVDPWLRTVGEQLQALPFGQGALPQTYFEPLLTESRAVFRQPSLRRRYQAWRRLRQHRIWSVATKDAYYKTRLFTDYVVSRAAA